MAFMECFNDISSKQILYINAYNDEQRPQFDPRFIKIWNIEYISSKVFSLISSTFPLKQMLIYLGSYETQLEFT